MTEIEKIKIDILRDALKDASDTVRTLDRKINFLVSYNAIFLGVIATLFLKYKDIKLIIHNYETFYFILGFIGFFWTCIFISIMMGISPKSNPIEVFNNDTDKEFSNNIFFISTDGKINSLALDNLLVNYSKINSYNKIQKLLYKEIGKVSYIRDVKLKSVSRSVMASWILTFIFVIFISIFPIYSSSKNINNINTGLKNNNSSKKTINISHAIDNKDINVSNAKLRRNDTKSVVRHLAIETEKKDINVSK